MGRAKKSRKTRSANRLAKRFDRNMKRAQAIEHRDRTEAREAIESSDMPDALKKLLGALVDPLGSAHKMVVEQVIGKTGFDPRPKDDER